MKAVLISPRPGVNAGGVERFCALLEQGLVAAGWEIETVGPHVTLPDAISRLGAQPLLDATSATIAARRARADLVISNGYLGGPTGTPRIHVFHGTMIRHVLAGERGSRRYRTRLALSSALPEALCARRATSVAVSRTAAEEVRRLYRQRVDAVIPNGVDVDLFRPGNRAAARAELGWDAHARIALFVGRLEYRKGADLIAEGARRAGYQLAVAGAHAPPDALPLGVLSPERLAVAYRAASCVLFPTRYEACSYVVLEALASGIPLVTTTAGWMGDFLARCPAYAPLIVTPDVDDIVATLVRLQGFQLEAALSAARAHVVAHNSLEVFNSSWCSLASKVVAT